MWQGVANPSDRTRRSSRNVRGGSLAFVQRDHGPADGTVGAAKESGRNAVALD